MIARVGIHYTHIEMLLLGGYVVDAVDGVTNRYI